jgi:hypothetical protein
MADWGQFEVALAGVIPVPQEADSFGFFAAVEFAVPTLPDPPTIPPTTTLVSPSSGSTLSVDTPVIVDVTDVDSGFARILVVVVIAPTASSGVALLAHDGVAFRPGFRDYSTRTVITGGFRYSIRRDVGWADPIRIEVYAIDDTGNEGTT